MRMRKKKNQDTRFAACAPVLLAEPQTHKGRWQELTGGRPLHLEIGCGKGKFITETAMQNPDIYYVAVERVEGALLMAMEKAMRLELGNLRFISMDAAALAEVFAAGEAERIYLNFSDPWPPKKQWKRRLTHRNMLAVYERFLTPGGEIHMKTDNRGLFEFSLCELSQCGYVLYDVTFDLHSLDIPNITTEYEEQFAARGMPIYRCVARREMRGRLSE